MCKMKNIRMKNKLPDKTISRRACRDWLVLLGVGLTATIALVVVGVYVRSTTGYSSIAEAGDVIQPFTSNEVGEIVGSFLDREAQFDSLRYGSVYIEDPAR
jgi:hypothetical protein